MLLVALEGKDILQIVRQQTAPQEELDSHLNYYKYQESLIQNYKIKVK